jgi:hypothetical protein
MDNPANRDNNGSKIVGWAKRSVPTIKQRDR